MRLAWLWWLPVVAAAATVAAFDLGADAGDIPFFLDAARTLLSADWSDTFADPDVQAGPLQLAALGVADALAGAISVSSLAFLAFALEVGAAALLLVVCRRVIPHAGRGVLLGTGLVAVAVGLALGAFVDGHPAQLVIPLLWFLGAREAREGRVVLAGAIVGVSAGLELWGVLGGVALFLAPRLRAVLAGFAVEAAVVAAFFAPFVLVGEFRMFDYTWHVAEGTLASLVLPAGDAFPWELRIAQGAVAAAVGTAFVYVLRPSRHAAWLALAAVLATRLALDPVLYSWYWLALQTVVLDGAAELASSATIRAVVRSRLWNGRTVPIEAP